MIDDYEPRRTYADIKAEFSYSELAKMTGLKRSQVATMERHQGFSANAIRAFLAAFPDIDCFDLIMRYPKPKKEEARKAKRKKK